MKRILSVITILILFLSCVFPSHAIFRKDRSRMKGVVTELSRETGEFTIESGHRSKSFVVDPSMLEGVKLGKQIIVIFKVPSMSVAAIALVKPKPVPKLIPKE